MRLEQLQYIVEIADSGSISNAAEKLHTSQPSISQSIVSLEKELNIQIFKRSRLGAQPTESGKLIIDKAREILKQINELNKIAKTQSSVLTGSVSVTAIPTMCITILSKALGVFKHHYPDVEIEVHEEGTKLGTQRVLEGKSEIGLISLFNKAEKDPRLEFEPLMPTRLMACVGSQSPLAKKKEVSMHEIIQYPIVTFNEKYKMNAFVTSMLKTYGEPNILFSSENSEVAKKVVVDNLAIGFYTDISLKNDPYVHNGQIVPLVIKEYRQNHSYNGIIYRKNAHLSAACQKFIDELRTQAVNFKRLYGVAEPDSYYVSGE